MRQGSIGYREATAGHDCSSSCVLLSLTPMLQCYKMAIMVAACTGVAPRIASLASGPSVLGSLDLSALDAELRPQHFALADRSQPYSEASTNLALLLAYAPSSRSPIPNPNLG